MRDTIMTWYVKWGFLILIGLTLLVEFEWIGPRVLSAATVGVLGLVYLGLVLGWLTGQIDAKKEHARDCPYESVMKQEAKR